MIVNMFLPPGQARAGDTQGSCGPSGGMRESLIAQDAIQAVVGKALRPHLPIVRLATSDNGDSRHRLLTPTEPGHDGRVPAGCPDRTDPPPPIQAVVGKALRPHLPIVRPRYFR